MESAAVAMLARREMARLKMICFIVTRAWDKRRRERIRDSYGNIRLMIEVKEVI